MQIGIEFILNQINKTETEQQKKKTIKTTQIILFTVINLENKNTGKFNYEVCVRVLVKTNTDKQTSTNMQN